MAWVQRDPSGNYHVSFRFGGKKFKRSLHVKEKAQAEAIVARIEENMRLVERGRLVIPEGTDIPTFLISDGKLTNPVILDTSPAITIQTLFDRYFASLPEGSREPETIAGMKIHQRHLERVLGKTFAVGDLNQAHLQGYIEKRSKEKGQRGKVTASTIRKALVTFRTVWNWGMVAGYVASKFPDQGLKYPKSKEKLPFQTFEEINRQLPSLSEKEQAELWDCLYLTREEIDRLLEHVKTNARHPFLYPMFVFAAHTGSRRAEMLRARVSDVDLKSNWITVHERKKSHDKQTTRRVPMSSLLRATLENWLESHAGGPKLFYLEGVVPQSKKKNPAVRGITRDEAHDHFKRTLLNSPWQMMKGWHVLRQSFISNCASQGIDQRIIQEWVGHLSPDTHRRYMHLLPKVVQDSVKRVFG